MAIELCVIFRKFLKEGNHVRNIGPDFDSGADHLGNLAKVKVFGNGLFEPGLCLRIEDIGVHGLEILSVHPAELCVVKDGRRTSHAVVVKLLDQLFQGEDLAVAVR